MDEVINSKVKELAVGTMELIRYLLAAGLEQLNCGKQPEKREIVTLRLEMPNWRPD
ncbi:MAG: hypothetical protein ACPG8W_02465 [Candidatus Promineifilaceae bacterium]